MKFACKTDIGKVRRSNQDSYAVGELPGGVGWGVVCDGMGGANGGNIASSTAVKTVSQKIASSWRPGMGANSIGNMLKSVVAAANVNVFDMAQSVEALAGMGTTIVLTLVTDNVAHIVHAGDSRAYHITKEGLIPITKDHSIVQSLVEQGRLTEEEAREHPRRNVITRALGVSEILEVDHNEVELAKGEGLLLCTDGLSGFVEKKDIERILQTAPFVEWPELLTELANENGGGDNITVVAIRN
ncbi:MAG: Stp1/IreP family PP2C-type Ser/Thr phosphatase [Clostridia bacterium]|nr:Stp1/IreP family PP2C-type Ser/Thr phosphatase [Clostridia bacterium]